MVSPSVLFNLYIVSDFGCMFLTRNCKKLNINLKSSHKIKETVIFTLADSGFYIITIREDAGHENERITYNHYTYNRAGRKEIENILEQSLSKTF